MVTLLSAISVAVWGLPAQAISFDALKQLIQERGVRSVEEVLPLLPASLRSRYALVFQSRSLQEASLSNPRVLLYGDNADLIVSFNGAPEQKGFNSLETLEFDPRANAFILREISFPGKNDQRTARAKFSEPNPEKCLRCHGSSARPIWDTQPLWPGSYGERYLSPLGPEERAGLASFLALQPVHPRYRNLLFADAFARKETFLPSHEERYSGQQEHSPNEILSSLLSEKNAGRIARELIDSGRFRDGMYLLLAALSKECEAIPEFFPKEQREGAQKRLSVFDAAAGEAGLQQERRKEERSLALRGSAEPLNVPLPLNAFRFIAEVEMGVSTQQWTTALEAGTYDLSAPDPIDSLLEKRLLAAAARFDPQLQRLSDLSHVGMPEKYCAYLRKKSAETFASLGAEAQIRPPKLRGAESIMRDCAGCHDGVVGPALPFQDSKLLARRLATGKYRRGTLLQEILFRLSPGAGADQMPVGESLSAGEARNLREFLVQLRSQGED